MKLKHKKTILCTILGIMGIGIVILSFSSNNHARLMNASSKADIPVKSDAVTPVATPISTPYPTRKPTPTEIPTPTPYPVYELETKGYPEINALMQEYYDAKINCDIDTLKNILSDPSDVPSLEQLQGDILYVEKYQALKCYIKKSYEEDSYIVYVYNEIKFLNIDTPAPAVDRFYLVTDEAGNLKIFSGTLDEERKKYYDERMKDEDVQKLINDTNAKSEAAEAKDELLKTFWEELKRRNTPAVTEAPSQN